MSPVKSTVRICADLSQYIYYRNYHCVKCPEEVEEISFQEDDFDGGRYTAWAIYVRNDDLFIVFRGSSKFLDWFVNMSSLVMKYPKYDDISVHSGFFTAMDNVYESIRNAIPSALNGKDPTSWKFYVTGHSKGAAVAQLFLHQFLNDEKVKEMIPEVEHRTKSITFATPMVFWFRNSQSVENIRHKQCMHSYITRGDMVPVLQLALYYNRKAVLWLLDPLLGGFVQKIAQKFRFFRPVGSINVGDACRPENYTSEEPNLDALDIWSCVRSPLLVMENHGMEHHTGCIISRENGRWLGVYVQNDTDIEILFVLSQVGPLHWAVIPPRKEVYVPSGRVWFTATATPHQAAACAVPSAWTVSLSLVGLGWLVTPTYQPAAGDPGRNYLTGLYANGSTVSVRKVDQTNFLELKLLYPM